MARSFAKIFQRIWADPAWRALDGESQHLYFLLISQPQMNLAGILPLQPRKWAACVSDWDVGTVEGALKRLSGDRFVIVDEDTEEVLVRSMIRNDEAYRTPGMLKSILKLAEGAQAPQIRGVLCEELGRLPRLEGKTGPENMGLIAATRLALGLLGGPAGPGGEPIPDGIGDGIRDGIPDGFVGTHRGYLPQSTKEPIADTSVSVSGSVAGVSHVDLGEGARAPAPPRCIRHADLEPGAEPPCRTCQRLREQWEAQQAEARKPRPRPAWCGQCDERTRQVMAEADGRDVVSHCPRCHPSTARAFA
jgi:hypothetical protein